YIAECFNGKVDMASMACGLEVRSPFLDHKLVEFCARVPSGFKIRNTEQKFILKQAFRDDLPVAEWLRHDLGALARDTLLSPNSCIRSLLRTEKVRMMLDEHAARKHNWQVQIWRLLVLESWMKANSTRGRPSS